MIIMTIMAMTIMIIMVHCEERSPSIAGWTVSDSAGFVEQGPALDLSQSKFVQIDVYFISSYEFHVFLNIDPVRIKDKDGAEAEDEKGGWSVNHSNYCPRLKDIWLL